MAGTDGKQVGLRTSMVELQFNGDADDNLECVCGLDKVGGLIAVMKVKLREAMEKRCLSMNVVVR